MDDYDRKIDWLRKKVDKNIVTRIEKTIPGKIGYDPKRATKRLQAESLKPQRTLRIGDWRLFFIYCEECRTEGHKDKWNCPNCGELPDTAVVLVNLEKRENAYG